ncbi:MAG: YmdB family metallophosphoesterase, partial [Verrucomicrobiota bacterium]
MKLLFVGDIVGSPGRRAVRERRPILRARHALEFVVVNGENAAGGNGLTAAIAGELLAAGVDVITTGDHVWDQKEVNNLLAREPRVLRPANYPAGVVGQGSVVIRGDGLPPVAVLNLQARTFMPPLENPFRIGREQVEILRRETPVIFVDFHGEATSEKIALGRMLDGQVSA